MGRRLALLLIALLVPVAAYAGGGLHHSTEFVMKRDGAWIVNFLILFSGLAWVTVRFILPALQKRSEDLAAAMARAEAAKDEATARLAELKTRMQEFQAESAMIQKEAQEQAEKLRAQIIADATAAAKRIVDKAHAEIASETVRAQTRLRRESASIAMEMATGLLSKSFNESDHRSSVGEYLKKVGEKR